MTQHQSFNNSIQKFQKIWEQNESNTSEIDNNLKKIQLDFKSNHFSKKITTMSILKDEFVATLYNQVIVIELNNFPEWLINHINVIPIVSPIGDINTDTVVSTPANVKIGDIIFNPNISKYWIAKISDKNYQLKVSLSLIMAQVTDLTPSFTILPFNLDLDLKIINPRIYEKANIHKS